VRLVDKDEKREQKATKSVLREFNSPSSPPHKRREAMVMNQLLAFVMLYNNSPDRVQAQFSK
jgi:hypothetical protein